MMVTNQSFVGEEDIFNVSINSKGMRSNRRGSCGKDTAKTTTSHATCRWMRGDWRPSAAVGAGESSPGGDGGPCRMQACN